MNELFFFLKDVEICDFADDTTIYICEKKFTECFKITWRNLYNRKYWFESGYMKLNIEKGHLIVSGYKDIELWKNIGKNLI